MRRRILGSPAALLLAVVALAACSRAADDQTLATNIKAGLYSDPVARGAALQVTVKNGEATLRGTVPDETTRQSAYRVASETLGVKKVNDEMTVETAQATASPASVPASEPSAPPPAPRKRTHRRTYHPAESARQAPPPSIQPEAPPSAAPASQVAEAPPPAPAPPPPPKPRKFVVPSGTAVDVRLIDSIDSKKAASGTLFRASLDAPIQVDGEDVVPRGAEAYVLLTGVKSAGHILGRSELRLELARLVFHGHTYALTTSSSERLGNSRGKQSAERIGGASAFGAVIGALAGGPIGAAIGATAGAAGGTGFQMVTHGQQIQIPSETVLRFRLEAPVSVTLPADSGNPGD